MIARCISFICLILLVAGCADVPERSPSNSSAIQVSPTKGRQTEKSGISTNPVFTHTIVSTVEYYNDGPQQARPPDGKFEIGTRVNLIENAGSYSRVRSEDGIETFVATDALKKLDGVEELVSGPDIPTIVAGNNKFAFDLYTRLGQEKSGNLFFSPNSISTAFAMTYAGARGETATQMRDVLGFDIPQDKLHESFAALADVLQSGDDKRGYQLNIANRLWGQHGYVFLPEFLRITNEQYGAELAQVNFANAAASARQINEWVEKQTAGKIKDLIPPEALTGDTRLVLTNAIYFKGDWTHKFKESATSNEAFHVTANDQLEVPMMFQTEVFEYGEADGVQFLGLPYGQHNYLTMFILLPRTIDGLGELESKLTNENLENWTARLSAREVEVYLPKFHMETEFELNAALQAMGMTNAFQAGTADFSGMSTQEDLHISAAIHKAFVDVNEKGTEAAAATGIEMRPTSAIEPEPVVFRADHPFVFLIRDNRTKSILFLGRVTDPK